MKIAISGSSGFIGKQLSEHLLRSGNEIIAISRGDLAGGSNQLAKVINSADVIINLAGSPILQRWTKKNRQLILSSRVNTTRLLVDAVQNNLPEHCPKVFISASAIGIYENSGIHDERSSALGADFLAIVCRAWENETEALKEMNIRLCTIRIGIVLGITGGSLQKMLPIFKIGLGGKIGSGKQPFSFIHITDLCRAIEHLITNDKSEGVYNLVSPNPITNELFTVALADNLHRPAFFTVPEFALKLVYGEASDVLTKGTCVKPARLTGEGFKFRFPDISSALADLVKKID
jgi:uncharacterized protein (TIGR01777 family)